MKVEGDVLVSVCVVTYNQENYIAECLESLVNQQTNFKFEIIVGEDCSTDNTRAIVKKYVEKYPDLVVGLFYENNVGPVENIKQVYLKAKGKYIAHMDGDDFALPNKLQNQFEILEKNKYISICSHNVKRIDSDAKYSKVSWTYKEGNYNALDFFEKLPFFAHSSKMFRNDFLVNFWEDFLNDKDLLDIDIHFESIKRGGLYHIGENLGVYRINVGMSLINKKINPVVPSGLERVFDKGIEYFREQPENIIKIKEYYSIACINSAFEFALFNQDKEKFKYYVYKSIKLNKKLNIIKCIFVLGTFFPKVFFNLLQIRSFLKKFS